METTIEKKPLKYFFAPDEHRELSLRLARKSKEVSSLEDEKKSIVSQYKAKIDEATAIINRLANQVNDGFEIRDIDCRVEYHRPKKGQKSFYRTDTNQYSHSETMTPQEWNLFTQWEEGAEQDETRLLTDSTIDNG